MTPSGRLAVEIVYGSVGVLLAVWGVRLIVYSDKIARRKAIKRGSVPSLYYSISHWFGQTEEDVEKIRGVTVMQGITWLLVAGFILYVVIEASVTSISK